MIVDRAYAGDYGPLAALTEPWNDINSMLSSGLLYSVACSEDVPSITAEERRKLRQNFLRDAHIDIFSRVCAFWPRGELPANYHDPVATDHPVLVLSGDLDPVTPPHWGEEVSQHLKNSRHIVVPGVGHGTAMGCVPKLMAQFINEADATGLDATCVDKLQRPAFFTTYLGPEPPAEEHTP